MALPAGSRLGADEIVSSLGAGGMGEVHRARDSRLGRDVALKVLPPDVTDDPSRLERFDREARAIAALNLGGFEATEKDRRGSQHQLPYDGAVPAPSP